jgi:hypothetical protein
LKLKQTTETLAKAQTPRTNPNTKESSTTPKPHTHPSHERDGQARNPGTMTGPPTPKPTRKAERFYSLGLRPFFYSAANKPSVLKR